MKAIVFNYGASNLYSVASSLERAGFEVEVSSAISSEVEADLMVLPGVGNFAQASSAIEKYKLQILEGALRGMTVLGICLGLHLMFEESEEGKGKGLGIIKGKVKRLRRGKVPHMGWSLTQKVKDALLLEPLGDSAWLYYAHSYAVPYVKDVTYAISDNNYEKIPSIILKGQFIGVQFHPEKSGKVGLEFLKKLREVLRR
ncbi:MAG: imidazole glycerol phosphate synthase subunit HisH [Nitrososphaeria archaeon]